MKRLFVFFCLIFAFGNAFSQNKIDEIIAMNANKINFTINNKSLDMEIDPNSDQIIMSFKELQMIVKKDILLYKANLKKDTSNVNGKKQVTISLSLDTLRFNCLLLLNVPAKIVYNIPQYDPNAKAKFGTNLLKKYGNLTVSANEIVVEKIDQKYIHQSCLQPNPTPIPNPPPVPNPAPVGFSLDYFEGIKIIPCSSDPTIVQTKSLIQDIFTNKYSFTKHEEENKIPPQKAVNNVKSSGITIRYFDDLDQNQIQELEKLFQKEFPNDQINMENMRSYFKNAIPKYVEIWIK